MKRHIGVFVLFCSLLSAGPALAQGLSGETEIGVGAKHELFFSQYLFYDFEHWNILTRYFRVGDFLERGEFAMGPTVKFGDDTVLKFQFGGTTEQDVMLAATLSTKIFGHDILYIGDGKISTAEDSDTLYQKAFVSLNESGSWQFRIEDLLVGGEQGFLRIGLEYQIKLPGNSHIFIAPFYDPIQEGVGGQIGFRFFP